MSNKAEREAFESWCKSVGYSTSPDYIDKRLYWYAETSAAWDAWQAAILQQQVAVPMSDSEIENLREKTFSTDNPYCPVDSKSMRKAVRATESHYGISSK